MNYPNFQKFNAYDDQSTTASDSTSLPKEGLTLSQEKRMLEDLRSDLTLSMFKLGLSGKDKFPRLAELIEQAVNEADRNAIAADDSLNERT